MASSLNFLQTAREDDFVEYFLYPSLFCRDPKEEQSVLKNYINQIDKVVEKHSKNYLWHRDAFKLAPRTSDCNLQVHEAETGPPHLYGISHYGDNIEDEWFIVFLLFQITKEIEGLVARVVDIDGEFLLIEAANFLPHWANPDICEKRVYIYQGSLHIVPPNDIENPADEDILIKECVSHVSSMPEETLASTDIQNSILNKIKGYPERIEDNLHATTVYLPVGVAAILKHKPALVAPAVQAFCGRDPIDMKVCRAMKYFPPENRVYCNVTFTKCLYAMLTHSRFVPDKRTGWNLPSVSSPQYKAHSLGVKLASGFEILVSQAKPSADVENDKGWHAYLKSLKERNYFRDLMEHSRDYNDLLNKAKEYYINYRDLMQSAPVIGQEILELTKNLDYNIEELKKAEAGLPEGDDDSWLNIDPKELDKMLQEQYGQKSFFPVNGNTDATSFTEKITKFLDHVSDVEGAEFPKPSGFKNSPRDSPKRPPRGIKRKGKSKVSFSSDTKLEDKPNSNKVNFDPAAFTCALQNILDFMIPDDDGWDLDSDSDMSAYGEEEEIDLEGSKEIKNKMQEYMEQMDRELAKTTIGQSFQKVEKRKSDAFDDVESFQPVDIDMNALKNVLESYQAQLGDAGPATNMLGPMGIHLEPGTSQENCKNGGSD